MEETNRIVFEFTIENWMIYLAVVLVAVSLADSTLNIYNWYLQRKIDKAKKQK